MKDINYAAIQRAYDSCTWGNSRETVADWASWLNGDDDAAKGRLFGRLFREAPDGKYIRDLFSAEQIKRYLGTLAKPFPRSHLERRRKVWRYLYLGERSPIPELDWIIRT